MKKEGSKSPTHQLALFNSVGKAYADCAGTLSQEELYSAVTEDLKLTDDITSATGKIHNGQTFNVFKRDCRWAQQKLKAKGLLKRVDRGMWELTKSGKEQLTQVKDGYVCLAFNTDLGLCLWSDAKCAGEDVINDQINLILTSPPYPYIKRNYGQFNDVKSYIRFVLETIEPFVKRLAPGGGLVLNVGNDVFEKGMPARSLYLERLLVELHDSLGLYLVERIPWKINKCPGPTQWAFVRRVMLRSAFEFTFVLTNDPGSVSWDNRQILEEHNEDYFRWCQQGGQRQHWENSTYSKRVGAFSGTKERKSKIPTNVIEIGHTCKEGRQVKKFARENNLPEHTATFPKAFAEFFIKWMTKENDLCADPFAGSLTTASAAEGLNRRWIAVEKVWEFIIQGQTRFPETNINRELDWIV